MGCRHDGSPVEENFNDLVIVGVGSEDERGDIGSEGGRVAVHSLPAPEVALLVDALLMVQQNLHRLHVLFMDGVQESILGLDLVIE